MDEKKQPGIKFKSIILVESNFKRVPYIPDDMEIVLSAQINNSFNNDKTECTTEMMFELLGKTNEKVDCVTINVKYVAAFLIDSKNNNMALDEFAKKNGPAHIYPFIREYIANTTTMAGMKPILLAPININALLIGK